MQENLLCLVCFDPEGKLVANLVPLRLWESFYKHIAELAYNFWSSYGKPPGEHTLDLIEDLCHRRPSDTETYRAIYSSMLQTSGGVNKQYVLGETTKFVRQQRLKAAIIEAVDKIEGNNLDEAERILTASMIGTAQLFDSGTRLSDVNRMLQFLSTDIEAFPVGIPELDHFSLGPTRKELHLFIAPAKRGKSWWLVHLGKQCLLHRLRVVHITLEMSEARVAQRYCQALFSVSKREEHLHYLHFDRDELGRFVSFREEEIPARPSLRDPDIRKFLAGKLGDLKHRTPLIIKQFPTGSLTVPELRGYLDALWLTDHISPDVLIIDYPDLMNIESRNYRIDLGRIYKDIRGIAVERNLAAAIASQSNRGSSRSRLVRDSDVAEDFSKIATADTIITYNQTDEEFRKGLARLFVSNCRNDADRQTVLISQNYKIGQFCLDSARMTSSYWGAVKGQSDDIEAGSGGVPQQQSEESLTA